MVDYSLEKDWRTICWNIYMNRLWTRLWNIYTEFTINIPKQLPDGNFKIGFIMDVLDSSKRLHTPVHKNKRILMMFSEAKGRVETKISLTLRQC